MGFFLDNIVVFLFGTAVRFINEHRSNAWPAAEGKVVKAYPPAVSIYPAAGVAHKYISRPRGRSESLPPSAEAASAMSAAIMTVTWRADEPSVGRYRPRRRIQGYLRRRLTVLAARANFRWSRSMRLANRAR